MSRPLNIKNTGHDYAGRSSAPGSLGLWTHNLKSINHTSAYTPAGCNQSWPAMTIGAGAQFREIYKYADVGFLSVSVRCLLTLKQDNNFTVVGGASSGVGMRLDLSLCGWRYTNLSLVAGGLLRVVTLLFLPTTVLVSTMCRSALDPPYALAHLKTQS